MILIVGLGNPGKKYQKTRHNAGFMIVDKLQEKDDFSDWKMKKKFKAEISEGIINNERIILCKPQTFMNESGKAVKKIISNFLPLKAGFNQFLISNLLIIHDDLDLPLGKIKIVKNRGHAGHKGVQSIINELGTKNFIRFRIGIKPLEQIKHTYAPVRRCEDFVLEKFNKEDEKIAKQVVEKTCEAIEIAVKQGIEKTMTQFNV